VPTLSVTDGEKEIHQSDQHRREVLAKVTGKSKDRASGMA
jgi:hypothetical protein